MNPQAQGTMTVEPNDAPIRILIVDDHHIVRTGLIQLISTDTTFAVVDVASDGAEAVTRSQECNPDVILMDLSMPRMDGVEAIRRIRLLLPEVKIVVLTSFSDEEKISSALEAGADGYLLKHTDPDQLLRSIREAYEGGAPFSAQAARVLLNARQHVDPGVSLTDRERDVLRLLREGLANKQIAIRLGIAERTVKAHLSSVFQQLGVQDRTSAAMWAQKNSHIFTNRNS